MQIILERFADTPFGVFGRICLDETIGHFCYTVERPWLNNEPGRSCIPIGEYPLRLRESPVVARSTNDEFGVGWEVCEVPGRTFIMIHPANRAAELEGCIAPGKILGCINREWAVLHSRAAFTELMAALPTDQEHTITIRWRQP